MKNHIGFAFVVRLFWVLVFLTSTAFAALPEKEVAEIKKFTDLENGKGQLLNPPRGSVKPEVIVVRDFVHKLVNELIGKQLQEKGIHVVINVYGNNSMNAWVQQMDPSADGSAEAEWTKKNPGEIWPLRKAWGFPDDKKPIYEIGITTGLLKKLSSIDELAFILGHETTHLLEGHTDHSENNKEAFKKWWSSQSHETVADHLGLDKILGKYELEAALTVMEKLHPLLDDRMSVEDALGAAVGTHHAEGVRIAAIQFYIEYLRRYNATSTPRTQIPIPDHLRLNVYGRNEPVDPKGDAKAREAYFKAVDQFLDNSFPIKDIYFDSHSMDMNERSERLKSPFANLVGSPDTKGFALLLMESLHQIESSSASKKNKMNALLKAMIFIGVRASSYYDNDKNWLGDLSYRERFELGRFLLQNTVGENPWTLEDYKSLMSEMPFEARSFIEFPLIRNQTGQPIFTTLTKISPVWKSLLEHWTSMDSFLRNNQYETHALGSLLNALDDGEIPTSSLRDYYRKRLIEGFTQITDVEKLITKTDSEGISEFRYIEAYVSPQRSEDSQKWSQTILDAKRKFVPAFQKRVLNQLVELFKKKDLSKTDAMMLGFALRGFDLDELESQDRNRLFEAYDQFIQNSLNPTRVKHSIGDSSMLMAEDFNMVAKLMERSMSDRAKILNYIRYISTSSEPAYFSSDHLPQATRDIFKKVANTLTKEEIISLNETLTPLEKEIWAEVAEVSQKLKATNAEEILTRLMKIADKAERMALGEKTFSWAQGLKKNYRIHANLLQFIGIYGDFKSSAYAQFNYADLLRNLRSYEIAIRIKKFDHMARLDMGAPQITARVLFEIFYQNIDSIPNFEQQLSTYERVLKISGPAFMPTAEQENKLREVLNKGLKALPLDRQVRWLKNEVLRKALGGEIVGETLAQYVFEITKKDRRRLKTEVDRVMAMIPLQEKWPDAFQVFRNKLSEKAQVQPSELKQVFSEDPRSVTEKVDVEGNLIRGMSSFSTFTRAMPFNEQIEMIEFIMGRTTKMPQTLANYKDKVTRGAIDVKQLFFKLREEMKFRSPLERAMVINSVLTGPNGMPANKEGLNVIHEHLLKAVSPANKEIALLLLESLKAAEGRNDTLILSYALAQKVDSTNSESGLTEGLVLKSLLDFYGVPGVKLAQYLAFTNEFKSFQSSLETYQDAAMPISYYEALLLLQKRLGDKWDPQVYQMKRILGSGSVNIAIEYLDLRTQKLDVVSIARDEIEVKTKEDFRRFQSLLFQLASNPKNKEKFQFVIGLMELIQKSVALEFDKPHSYKMQKSVQKLYKRKVDGWNIQSIDAYSVSVEGMAIFMEKAPGVGARKVFKNDPATYESAMRAFLQVEYAALRGVNETGNWVPVSLHANPDIHDGQIMIDVETRTITVLDFGQALEITNAERDFALDILRIISDSESVPATIKLIRNFTQNNKAKFDEKELGKILKLGDRMDVFIHLLSYLERIDVDVPLSTVHWVLAANRMIKLGEKIKISSEASVRWMLMMKKVGLPLQVYNGTKDVADKVSTAVNQLGHDLVPDGQLCGKFFH